MPITGATLALDMDIASLFIGLLLGLLLGVVGYAWWSRGRESGTGALLREQHSQERADLERRLNEHAREAGDRTREAMGLNAQLAGEVERNRGLQEKLDNQKADLEKAQARMTTEFEVIANKLLTARGK